MKKDDLNGLLSYRENPEKLLTLYRHIKRLKGNESEYLAEALCSDWKMFKLLPTVIRTHLDRNNPNGFIIVDYRDEDSRRKGEATTGNSDDESNRNEERIAMDFYNNSNRAQSHVLIPELGYILDYQTPIGGNLDHLSVDGKPILNPDNYSSKYKPGKCDLLSYEPSKNLIYILELKDEDSKEPLLSAVVEAYTYLQIIDKDALRENMKKLYSDFGIDDNTRFVAAPLIYKNEKNEQYKQLECKNVRMLEN